MNFNKLLSYTRAAIEKYNMIQENDKIAIGVSGGKDSIILLMLMSKLKKFYKFKFKILAVVIDPCFNYKNMNTLKIENICHNLGEKYIIKKSNLGQIIFINRKEKNPCSLCAKMRKGILHDIAIKNGCNKIALGHHLDDAVETFFMNLFNGGKIGCFSPVSYLSRKNLYLIRPMIFCKESDIKKILIKNNIHVEKSTCPIDGKTERENIKKFIKNLENKYPDIKNKTLGAIQRANIDNWKI